MFKEETPEEKAARLQVPLAGKQQEKVIAICPRCGKELHANDIACCEDCPLRNMKVQLNS